MNRGETVYVEKLRTHTCSVAVQLGSCSYKLFQASDNGKYSEKPPGIVVGRAGKLEFGFNCPRGMFSL